MSRALKLFVQTWYMGHFMTDTTGWRIGIFLLVLLGLISAERLFPRKMLTQARPVRWRTNGLIFVCDSLLTRSLFFVSTIAASLYAEQAGWGLFRLLDLPYILSFIATLILLDFAIWVQHVVSHLWPPLWRLHRVHHSDRDIDVTTALRFHPLEIGLSLLYKAAIIVGLGAPVVAVIAFDILLNGLAMFNHANLNLPPKIDRYLRWFIVTPDMHRVHHSVYPAEINSNYGFCLSIWDRLFGVYKAQPQDGHAAMQTGLKHFRSDAAQSFLGLLGQPFVHKLE